MAKVSTTVSLDETLMRRVRVRAARSGTTESEMLERSLREGLGILDRCELKRILRRRRRFDWPLRLSMRFELSAILVPLPD